MAIAVLGMGKTGRSLCRYWKSQGKETWGIDDRADLPNFEEVSKAFVGGKAPDISQVEQFFISPGVDPKHPVAKAALKAGLKLEGELDLAFSLHSSPVVAITGTNGKSTTTSLVGEILKQAGFNIALGGNLGTPYLDLVMEGRNFSHYVLEVSSFQLEITRRFRPKIAALLNLSDDHLDRHPNLNNYLQAKAKIFSFQESEDLAVYNDDDLRVLEATQGIPSQKVPFSTTKKVMGAYGNEGEIHWAPEGNILSSYSLDACPLKGLHNLENIAAAIAIVKSLGLSDEAIQKGLAKFEGLPHRIQKIREFKGVEYYDDSKATNVGAVVMSLASFERDVVLILGGVDKGGDYAPLRPLLKHKCAAVILIGEASEILQNALQESTKIFRAADMEKAVELAKLQSPPGGVVLLSPACSSFDMYSNYKERGLDFQKQVNKLS